MSLSNKFYFFIGTEAELIKLLPIFFEFEKRKITYRIIASGQNDINNSKLFNLLKKKRSDITIFNGAINQTSFGLFLWFLKIIFMSFVKLRKEFKGKKNDTIFIVHGDTISTVLGAILGKLYHFKIAHIEAGLRSFNYFLPFPEELDRVIVSNFASLHFSPNKWAMDNLKNKKGEKINTFENTLFDSLQIALKNPIKSSLVTQFSKEKFFIFVCHRQENIYNRSLINELVTQVINASKSIKCLFVVHKPTKISLEKYDLYRRLENEKNITLVERVDYFEFMQLLSKCEFIITDGGSNQEESYYLGKPCLILRTVTERIEGLDENVLLYRGEMQTISKFIKNYKNHSRPTQTIKVRPSTIIANYLINQ